MNPIDSKMRVGTIGELLVQLRLLQHDVQAAPALKDSGNDLIAVRGSSFRAIQVKTTTLDRFDCSDLTNKKYHIAALVRLAGEDEDLRLDSCTIYLLLKKQVKKSYYKPDELKKFTLRPEVIDRLFR